MRNISIFLLFAGFAVLIQSSPEDGAVKIANEILKKMDVALETKDFKEFLAIHATNFHFKFCKVTGNSVEDLKKILETDPNMSESVKSKHNIVAGEGSSGVTKVSADTWKFGYQEALLHENQATFVTTGSINFVVHGSSYKVVSAIEDCPKKAN
uniref:DUF4440 domain-containing protein n=1 Tax=Caenorhabditis tropicalis TaxID=1561998 RepID=A0A1I7SXV4_9PELO